MPFQPMRYFLSALILIAALFWAPSSRAADFYLYGGGGDYNLKTKSWLDRRYRGVIKQNYDFSCGSAALATLLTYHYEMPVNEKKVLDAMYRVGDQPKIRREGFSLLDMKKYLESIGLRAEGYKEGLNKLVRVGIPAITLINYKGYLHFVVVKGVNNHEVLVSDPAYGTRTFSRRDFEQKMWNGILFVVNDRMNIARNYFNNENTWALKDRGYFNTGLVYEDLGTYTLHITPTPGFFDF